MPKKAGQDRQDWQDENYALEKKRNLSIKHAKLNFTVIVTHHSIPQHGGYAQLLSYQKAEIIYDGTVYFTKRFLRISDRTVDQMIQSARSGKQNIVEGSEFSATSKEIEIKLINTARSSQEELLTDYCDFLRTRKLQEWPDNHPYTQRLRELHRIRDPTYATYQQGIEHADPAICANVMIG